MSKFSERLKELREEKGLSQRDLAKATGISQNAITCWETEKSLPIANAIITLAGFFDVTTDYLLGVTDN
ncbi:MAG: helix-turn-helix domain-containing protein [Firmicutes bacterium]|nr:helix-turn-helix domain-containing protein [Bacillota bacterium]